MSNSVARLRAVYRTQPTIKNYTEKKINRNRSFVQKRQVVKRNRDHVSMKSVGLSNRHFRHGSSPLRQSVGSILNTSLEEDYNRLENLSMKNAHARSKLLTIQQRMFELDVHSVIKSNKKLQTIQEIGDIPILDTSILEKNNPIDYLLQKYENIGRDINHSKLMSVTSLY